MYSNQSYEDVLYNRKDVTHFKWKNYTASKNKSNWNKCGHNKYKNRARVRKQNAHFKKMSTLVI